MATYKQLMFLMALVGNRSVAEVSNIIKDLLDKDDKKTEEIQTQELE